MKYYLLLLIIGAMVLGSCKPSSDDVFDLAHQKRGDVQLEAMRQIGLHNSDSALYFLGQSRAYGVIMEYIINKK